jgi:hypothetical protein
LCAGQGETEIAAIQPMLAQQGFHHLRHRHVLEQAGGAAVLQQGQARADVEGIQRFFPAAAATLRLTHHPCQLRCPVSSPSSGAMPGMRSGGAVDCGVRVKVTG